MMINGDVDRRFTRVRDEFERNFEERGEVGAAVCVTLDGETVVDLWAGQADSTTGRRWERDTAAVVFSTTKGMTALVAHLLQDRGLLSFDAPVATCWPEFAAAGKADLPVRMLLNHQAGLPAWRERLPDGAFYDWDLCVSLLAQQEPFWEPGTRVGYHSIAFGYLVGEVIRRVAGKSVGQVLAEEIAGPLGADVWIGLPEQIEPRVARSSYLAGPDTDAPFFRILAADPHSIQAQVAANTGGWFGDQEQLDSRASHAAEMPAVGGIATARGLATMYAPLCLDGAHDGVRILSPDALPGLGRTESRIDIDTVLRIATTFTLGFMKSWDNRGLSEGTSMILGEQAFGHAGLGGSVGFADPGARMSFGYVMNEHGPGTGLNRRGQSLVDAVYTSLGAVPTAGGYWAAAPRP
ncbi:MAG: beta-lactamase family protein [Hamadaea sp.]|nr:beta-lactamase family protein [Hamadaea sp.]